MFSPNSITPLLLMAVLLLYSETIITNVAATVTVIDGCSLVENNTTTVISLSASPPATRLQVRFVDCMLEEADIILETPHTNRTDIMPADGTTVVLERFTMRNGSFVITPALPLAADSYTRPLVENIAVSVDNVVMDGLTNAVVLDASAAAVEAIAQSPPRVLPIMARNVSFTLANSSLLSPEGNALSIIAGRAAVEGISIGVSGPATIIAGKRLAASIEAATVNHTKLSARVTTGPVAITAGSVDASSNGVGALGIVQQWPALNEAVSLFLSDVHIEAGVVDAHVSGGSTSPAKFFPTTHDLSTRITSGENSNNNQHIPPAAEQPVVMTRSASNHQLIISATADYCAAAGGACCGKTGTGQFAKVILNGTVFFQGVLNGHQGSVVIRDATRGCASAFGVAIYAVGTAETAITVFPAANVHLLGWAGRNGTILCTTMFSAASAGVALYSAATSAVTISTDANVTMLAWSTEHGSIHSTATTSGAAVAGFALSAADISVIAISDGAVVTLLGWSSDGGAINATARQSSSTAVGMTLYGGRERGVVSLAAGATLAIQGFSEDLSSIQATIFGTTGPAAAVGVALYASDSCAFTISAKANVTIVGSAAKQSSIRASATYAAVAVGIALIDPSHLSTAISFADAATVTIIGHATRSGSIQASAATSVAAAAGIGLQAVSSVELIISSGSSLTMLGWASENSTIHATARSVVAASVGVAGFSGQVGAQFTVSDGANFTIAGWAAEQASIRATADSSVAAVGIALYALAAGHTSIVISNEASLILVGHALTNGTIEAVAFKYAASAISIVTYCSSSASVAVSQGASVSMLGWATENGTIRATSITLNAAAAIGIAMFMPSSSVAISITDNATMSMHGFATRNGVILATVRSAVAVSVGVAAHTYSGSTVSIDVGANVTFLGWASEGGEILASAAAYAAAVAGVALSSSKNKPSVTISQLANVAVIGWASEGGTLAATAPSWGAGAVVAMSLFSLHDSNSITISAGATLTFQGWATQDASIASTASAAAAVGMALSASAADCTVLVSSGAALTIFGSASENGSVHATATAYTNAAAAVGVALHTERYAARVSISDSSVTLLGSATEKGSIRTKTPLGAAAAVGISVFGVTSAKGNVVSGAIVTILGWGDQNGSIQSTAGSTSKQAVTAVIGMSIYGKNGASSTTISKGSNTTILGWAANEVSISAIGIRTSASTCAGLTAGVIDVGGTLAVWVGDSNSSTVLASSDTTATAIGLYSQTVAIAAPIMLTFCHDSSSTGSAGGKLSSTFLTSAAPSTLVTGTELALSDSTCSEQARNLRQNVRSHTDEAEKLLNSSIRMWPQLPIGPGEPSAQPPSPPKSTRTVSNERSATPSLLPTATVLQHRSPSTSESRSEQRTGSRISDSSTIIANDKARLPSATPSETLQVNDPPATPTPATEAPAPTANVSSPPVVENEGPEPVEKLPQSSRVATQVSTTTVSVGASLASSTTAAADLQSVMVAMQALGDCGSGGAGGVGEAGNGALVPFTIGSGATQGVYALLALSGGGVVLNLGFVALARALKRDNSQCWGAGRFPSVAIRLFDYAYQGLAIEVMRVLTKRKYKLVDEGTTSSATTAYLRIEVTASDQAVAIAALLLVCIAFPVAMNIAVLQHFDRFDAEFMPFRQVFRRSPRVLRMLVLPSGFWTSPVKRQLGALFSSYKGGGGFRWFLFPYVRALAVAVTVVAVDSCAAKIGTLAAVVFIGMAGKVALRLQRLRLTLTLSTVNDGILLAMIAAGSADRSGGVTVALGVAAMGVSVLGTLATVVLKLRVEKQWRRKEQLLADQEDAATGGGIGGASIPMLAMPSSNGTDSDSSSSGSDDDASTATDQDSGTNDDDEDDSTVANPLEQH